MTAAPTEHIAQRGPRAYWRRPGSFPIFRVWGSCSEIARTCGVTPQSVSEWKRVPERHAATVARLLGTTVERLRPDLALRNIMTKPDMDPRDAAIAELTIAKAVEALDGRRIEVQERRAAAARSAARLEEVRLEHERDQLALKQARGAMSRTRSTWLHAGVPAARLDQTDRDPTIPTGPLPSQGVGGVEN
jgi:hypothetical protein